MSITPGISHLRLRLTKILDATLGYWLCWVLGYLHYLRNHTHAPTPVPGKRPERILVIRPGGMGDMILLIPALKTLAQSFPSATIDIICERRNIDVLKLAGFEKNAIAYDAGLLRVLHILRSRRYDIALDTEQFHHFSAIIAFLSRAPVRIGFKINPQRNLLYTHLVNYDLAGYEGLQFLKLLEPAGCRDLSCTLEGAISTSGIKIPPPMDEQLASLARSGTLVTIHTGSTSIYKQWDTGKFVSLISTLITGHRCSVALIGGDSNTKQSEEILSALGSTSERAASFTGSLTLQETAEVIRQSRLFISGDSGLAHLAVAAGTPTLVIFGPTDPEKWGHKDQRHAIVRKSLACSPCFIFGYHKLCRSIDCMAGISTEEVVAICSDLLKSQEQGTSRK